MKHTPGPWDSDRGFRDSHPYGGEHTTIDNDYLTILMGDYNEEEDNFAEVHGPNEEANARLIAAAPDLLEALKLGHRKLLTYGNCYPDDKELHEHLIPMWKAAIAKAEEVA